MIQRVDVTRNSKMSQLFEESELRWICKQARQPCPPSRPSSLSLASHRPCMEITPAAFSGDQGDQMTGSVKPQSLTEPLPLKCIKQLQRCVFNDVYLEEPHSRSSHLSACPAPLNLHECGPVRSPRCWDLVLLPCHPTHWAACT